MLKIRRKKKEEKNHKCFHSISVVRSPIKLHSSYKTTHIIKGKYYASNLFLRNNAMCFFLFLERTKDMIKKSTFSCLTLLCKKTKQYHMLNGMFQVWMSSFWIWIEMKVGIQSKHTVFEEGFECPNLRRMHSRQKHVFYHLSKTNICTLQNKDILHTNID